MPSDHRKELGEELAFDAKRLRDYVDEFMHGPTAFPLMAEYMFELANRCDEAAAPLTDDVAAELVEEVKRMARDIACMKLCILQNDSAGAVQIADDYGSLTFKEGPSVESAALARYEARKAATTRETGE